MFSVTSQILKHRDSPIERNCHHKPRPADSRGADLPKSLHAEKSMLG